MDEPLLLKIALLVSLVGIVALFFLSRAYEATDTKIIQLGEEDVGARVKVTGSVVSVSGSYGMKTITLAEEATSEVRAYGMSQEISPGDRVEVIGRVSDKDGSRLIDADQIRKIG